MELIGKTINGYQIVEQIGKGGMAHVYKAYQPSLDRYVALKVLPPYYTQQDQTFMARFQREAKAIAKLRHPNILLVIDYGEFENIAYIVMEYVPAGTLQDRMKNNLSLTEIHSLIEQVGKALDYAHKQGIIHRDIKPSNILMPEPDWALLTDFGLARMVVGDNTNLTQSGMAVGTPAYMAPEQGQGLAVDYRSDIYSLGVILYEMIVGEAPYSAETPMAVLVKHIIDPLPIISNQNPNIPDDVQRIVLKALAKSPDDRYQTADELIQALATIKQKYGDWLAPTVQVKSLDPAETFQLSTDPAEAHTLVDINEEPEKTNAPFSWPFLGGFAGAMTALAALAVVAIVSGVIAINVLNNRTTPAPLPTATHAAMPTVAPVLISGEVVFTDDFSDPESGWDRYSDRDYISDYQDGEYRIRMLNTEFLYWANPYLYFDDVIVEADAYLADGSELNGYGLICGYQDDENFFITMISSDGFYEFWKFEANEFILLGGDSEHPHAAILGGSATNHIRIDCIDNSITLYVNGEFIAKIDVVLHSGDVGIWAEGDVEGPIEIRYDNFKVTRPND